MVINGKEVDFKISNKRHAANYSAALKEMEVAEKKIRNTDRTDLIAVLDAVINMFRDFFITATGVDVLEDCEDADEAKTVYIEFLTAIKEQQNKFVAPFSLERIK